MSDEAAKRRELRKQRILGNSENRLKRILNKEEGTDSVNQNAVNGNSEPADAHSLTKERNDPALLSLDRTLDAPPLARTPLISDLVNDPYAQMAFPDIASLLGSDLSQNEDSLSSQQLLNMSDLENLSNTDNPMELLCRLAASLDQKTSNAVQQPPPYQGPAFLVNSHNASRIRFIFILGILSRLLLPSLPVEYAKLFAPLYLIEILLFSLCIVYKAPLEHSSMSFAYSLMSLIGVHSTLVKVGKKFSACLELLLRDLWSYSFSFFITHALCQQLEIFETSASK